MGYSNVIRALISDDSDSGILIGNIPQSFVGKTYNELKEHQAKLRSKNGILVGLLLNSGNFHLRRMEAIREAQKNPNLNAVLGSLQKVKSLVSNEPVFSPKGDFIVPKNARAIFVRGKNIAAGEREE